MVTVSLLPFDLQLKIQTNSCITLFPSRFLYSGCGGGREIKKKTLKKTGRQPVWSLVTALLLQPKQTETKQT